MEEEEMNDVKEKDERRSMNACEAPVMLSYMCPTCGREYKIKSGRDSGCPACKAKKEGV
jgi:rubrerythrin